VQCQEVKVLTSAATRISELCGLHLSSLVFLSVFKSEILVSVYGLDCVDEEPTIDTLAQTISTKVSEENVSMEQVNKGFI